jgi:hypothetical protein
MDGIMLRHGWRQTGCLVSLYKIASKRFECRNSTNPLLKNHSTFLFTSLHLSNVFTGLFSEMLKFGIFQNIGLFSVHKRRKKMQLLKMLKNVAR